jgi:hypothetical protein
MTDLPELPTMEIPARALGRIYAPDPRDQRFPLKDVMPRSALRAAAWKTTQWMLARGSTYGDQGPTSTCVRYGCTHLLLLSPIVRKTAFTLTEQLYTWAQDNDEWPGNAYDGTSVRAGLQFLRKVAGLITEFRWATSMDDVRGWLTRPKGEGGGPLVVGTDWWTGMDNLGNAPALTNWWAPEGSYRGGHCWVIRSFIKATAKREAYYGTANSHRGNHAGKIKESHLEYLLFQANGEAAAVLEVAA